MNANLKISYLLVGFFSILVLQTIKGQTNIDVTIGQEVLQPGEETAAFIVINNPVPGLVVKIEELDPKNVVSFRDTTLFIHERDLLNDDKKITFAFSVRALPSKTAKWKENYSIEGSFINPHRTPLVISGYKFNDLNANGQWDRDPASKEPAIENQEIILSGPYGVQTILTGKDGKYQIPIYHKGDYMLYEKNRVGWHLTTQPEYFLTIDLQSTGELSPLWLPNDGQFEGAYLFGNTDNIAKGLECQLFHQIRTGSELKLQIDYPLRDLDHSDFESSSYEVKFDKNTPIKLGVRAWDRDILEHTCQCLDKSRSIYQVVDNVNLQWSIVNENGSPPNENTLGRLVFIDNPQTQLMPPELAIGETYTALVKIVASDSRHNESASGTISIEIKRRSENDYLYKLASWYGYTPYNFDPLEDIFNAYEDDCDPLKGEWEAGPGFEISTENEVEVCPGSQIYLKAIATREDIDFLTLKCRGFCGADEVKVELSDELTFHWTVQPGQGSLHLKGANAFSSSGKTSAVAYYAPETPGRYRIDLKVEDSKSQGADPTYELEGGIIVNVVGLEFLDADKNKAGHAQIARWDKAYNGDVFYNRSEPTKNFVDLDPERFYVQLSYPLARKDQEEEENFFVQISTLSPSEVDDGMHPIDLYPSDQTTSLFESKSQMLMSPDLPDSPDDKLHVHDGESGPVRDNRRNDRTHRTSIDGVVRAEYKTHQGTVCSCKIPVCDREPDERKVLKIQFVVFNDLFKKEGRGRAAFDKMIRDQLERANIGWAQACIKIDTVGPTKYEAAPLDDHGSSTFEEGFSLPVKEFDGRELSKDLYKLIDTYSKDWSDKVLWVFIVDDLLSAGRTFTPKHDSKKKLQHTIVVMSSKLNIARRTLAHEIGHALTNQGDVPNPTHIFFPQKRGSKNRDYTGYDTNFHERRRIPKGIANDAQKSTLLQEYK